MAKFEDDPVSRNSMMLDHIPQFANTKENQMTKCNPVAITNSMSEIEIAVRKELIKRGCRFVYMVETKRAPATSPGAYIAYQQPKAGLTSPEYVTHFYNHDATDFHWGHYGIGNEVQAVMDVWHRAGKKMAQ